MLPPAERRSVVLVTAYAALSLLLLVVGERIPAGWLRGTGAVVFAPFDRVAGAVERLFSSWNEITGLHDRIARLEVENARLRLMAAETPRLRAQLGLPAWRGLTLPYAQAAVLCARAQASRSRNRRAVGNCCVVQARPRRRPLQGV